MFSNSWRRYLTEAIDTRRRKRSFFGECLFEPARQPWSTAKQYSKIIEEGVGDPSQITDTPPTGSNTSATQTVRTQTVNLAENDPHRLGRLYLQDYNAAGWPTLVYHRQEYLRWQEGSYRPVEEKEIRAEATRRSRAEFDSQTLEAEPVGTTRQQR